MINAAGADTLYQLYDQRGMRWNGGNPSMQIADDYYAQLDADQKKASTIASAIEINRPVNFRKCLRALETCDGVVRRVTDQEILDAKAQVGAGGVGCEPASAASVAGASLLRSEGIIGADERVVCILTGHQLKDPTATVAYHTTDQDQFNRSWAAAAFAAPRSRIGPWRSPTTWAKSSKRSGCTVDASAGPSTAGSQPPTGGFTMSTIRLAIHGAAGRMGQRLIALAAADPQLQVVAALESPRSPGSGTRRRTAGRDRRAGGARCRSPWIGDVDCVIDFSVPEAADRVAVMCQQHKLPLVLATTGLSERRRIKWRRPPRIFRSSGRRA